MIKGKKLNTVFTTTTKLDVQRQLEFGCELSVCSASEETAGNWERIW
jgi:hypothetical protein